MRQSQLSRRVRNASGDLVEGDAVAEGVESLDVVVAAAVGVVSAGEVVAAEVVVVDAFGEQVPADHEDRVADRDGGFLLADAAGEPPELGGQVGVAAGGGGPGALVEDLAEPLPVERSSVSEVQQP